jgi:hypothetical protein
MRPLLVLLAVLAGCDNSCQTLCVQMADFSAECGRTISDAELQSCLTSFESVEAEERQTCRDFGNPDVIRREWTCDDLNLFRDVGNSGGGGDAE